MKFLTKVVDTQFLIRVIKNEISPEEREFFERWLDQSDQNKEEFSSISLLWDKFQFSRIPVLPDPEEEWNKIQTATAFETEVYSPVQTIEYLEHFNEKNNFSFSESLSWFYRFAAVLVLGAAFYLLFNSVQYTTTVKNSVQETAISGLKFFTASTGKGERATLTLSDGSIIQLNSLSKIRYPNYFSSGSREVDFEGEAYFKIARDKTRPFRVKCNNAVTEVTGTEFNIRNRENKFSITVVEGSVKMFNRKVPQGVDVKKGEMVYLKSTGNFTRPLKVRTGSYLVWRDNKISFSHTPLYEAAAELERNYDNLKIVFLSDSIKNKTITGVFNTNSLDDILSIMNLTLDIKITRQGDKIYFE